MDKSKSNQQSKTTYINDKWEVFKEKTFVKCYETRS